MKPWPVALFTHPFKKTIFGESRRLLTILQRVTPKWFQGTYTSFKNGVDV